MPIFFHPGANWQEALNERDRQPREESDRLRSAVRPIFPRLGRRTGDNVIDEIFPDQTSSLRFRPLLCR